MELAKQAIKEGILIDSFNMKYKGENLYDWVGSTVKNKYKKSKLSLYEIRIIEKLIGKSLDDRYHSRKNPIEIKVIDIIENKEIGIFESIRGVERIIKEKYDIKIDSSTIRRRLTGKIITPYKGRFMFYRVDEEVTE